MRTSSAALLVVSLVLAAPNVGCSDCGGGNAGAGPGGSASSAPSAVGSVPSSPRIRAPMVHATGTAGALFRAAGALELEDDQRDAIEKIGVDLREAEKSSRDAVDGGARSTMKEALEALAAGVKVGKIETAKLDEQHSASEKSLAARHEREADALNRLHATLGAAQRTAVVTTVRTGEEKRAARMKERERPDAAKPNASRARLERYMRGVELDANQQKKIEALYPKEDRAVQLREEAKQDSDALLAAFEKDGFDAKKFGTDVKQARSTMDEQVKFLAQVVPILSAEQREKLSKNVTRAHDHHARPSRPFGFGERGHDHDDDEH